MDWPSLLIGFGGGVGLCTLTMLRTQRKLQKHSWNLAMALAKQQEELQALRERLSTAPKPEEP